MEKATFGKVEGLIPILETQDFWVEKMITKKQVDTTLSKEELLQMLAVKQNQINSLLEVTKAVNNNYSKHAIFRIFEFILRAQFDVNKILLFSRTAKDGEWVCGMEHNAEDAIQKIAEVAWQVNETTEDIGARRLHTVMEKLLEEISFTASDSNDKLVVDAEYVRKQLGELAEDEDLTRFIL